MSNSRVRGSKRKELIEKWLNGEEDEEYEVKPTRTEGKFVIRKRKNDIREGNESISDAELKPSEESPNQNISESHERIKSLSASEATTDEPKSHSEASPILSKRNKKQKQNTLNQILEQLRILGEQQKSREERKQRKRETKMEIFKHMNSLKQYNREPDYSESSDEEIREQQPTLNKPILVRRRLNLLNGIH